MQKGLPNTAKRGVANKAVSACLCLYWPCRQAQTDTACEPQADTCRLCPRLHWRDKQPLNNLVCADRHDADRHIPMSPLRVWSMHTWWSASVAVCPHGMDWHWRVVSHLFVPHLLAATYVGNQCLLLIIHFICRHIWAEYEILPIEQGQIILQYALTTVHKAQIQVMRRHFCSI